MMNITVTTEEFTSTVEELTNNAIIRTLTSLEKEVTRREDRTKEMILDIIAIYKRGYEKAWKKPFQKNKRSTERG